MTETAAEVTASAVRAELARRRISKQQFAADLGWTESSARRRLSGAIPLDVNELTRVAAYLEVPVSTLVTEGAA